MASAWRLTKRWARPRPARRSTPSSPASRAGVAALIVPWNWPLSILGAKLPQALVTGNTVVVKPAENSALAPMLTLQIIAKLLPPGVVNVLTGSSREIGDVLTGHPLVRKVNFTGSVPVGKHVMKVAAENLTPVTLELGGNDAALMLEDIELNDAVFDKMYWAAFASSGQICMALKRMYVHESRYDEVVDGFTAACERAVVGDGLLPETTMGPVNNARQLKVVTRHDRRGPRPAGRSCANAGRCRTRRFMTVAAISRSRCWSMMPIPACRSCARNNSAPACRS